MGFFYGDFEPQIYQSGGVKSFGFKALPSEWTASRHRHVERASATTAAGVPGT
jgi:hypothetical protein